MPDRIISYALLKEIKDRFKMRSSIFILIGAIHSNSDATIEGLRDRLENVFSECPRQPQFRLNEGLLILIFTKPDFRFHLAFEKQ